MRILSSLLCVLFLCGAVLAADTTSVKPAASPGPAAVPAPEKAAPAPAAEVPAPAPAPAPAPVVEAPAPAPAPKPAEPPKKAAVAPASPLLTWNGLAMFRLRDEIVSNFRGDAKTAENGNFSGQIAYKLGVKVKPNDQVMLQFEIGNDWYATEEVEGLPGNYWTKRNPMTPWFDLAYVQWDPGYMHILAGIIPVKGSAMMDLLGVSTFLGRTYKKAAHIPWGVVTNFSQTGLRMGAPIIKEGPVTLGVDATASVYEMRKIATGLDTMKLNPVAMDFQLDIPVTVQALTVTPQAFIIPNRSYNMSSGKSDLEFGAGFDLGYKLNDGIAFRAGFGYARNSNRNSCQKDANGNYNTMFDYYGDPFFMSTKNDTVNKIVDSVLFDRWGTNLNVGTTVKLGPGKLDFDFNLSNEQNMYNTNIDDWYPFFDIKYGLALNKNFILMPRIRLFFTEPKAAVGGVKYNNMLNSRPELIFTGVF
jgi:hypothetical protein